MCGKGEVVSICLKAALLLAVCVFGLTTHFVAEGLSPMLHDSAFGFASDSGHVNLHLTHEHSDFFFLIAGLISLPWEHCFAVLCDQAASGALAYSISPPLPPPKF